MTAILVAFMVLFYSFQSLFTRLYSASYKGPDAAQSTTTFNICFGAFIGLATLITGSFSFAPSWQTVLCGALNAGMLLLYNTAMIESGNRGSYSFLMIASLFGCIIVPLTVGALFLGETLNAVQIIAIILMLISFVVMNARSISFKGNSGAYYFWCAMLFLSNGAFSTIMNIQQQAAAALGTGDQRTEMIAIVYLGMALAVLIAQLVRGGGARIMQGFKMGKMSAVYVILCSIFATMASNLLLTLLTKMDSGILYTIDNGGVLVLSVLYSFFLFKERPKWEQIIGIVLAVVSIVMISL